MGIKPYSEVFRSSRKTRSTHRAPGLKFRFACRRARQRPPSTLQKPFKDVPQIPLASAGRRLRPEAGAARLEQERLHRFNHAPRTRASGASEKKPQLAA